MQQHYQVINLHNIIRSQQSKLHQLKQQLRIANQRQQNRYLQIMQNNQINLDNRDKMIEYLKQELDKTQSTLKKQTTNNHKKIDFDKQNLQKQILGYKKKCIELQGKIKRIENQSQLKITQLHQQNRKVNEQIQKYNNSKNSLTTEISKLNHFYKNSLFQLSKRKQTLLWVDKFTQYLQSSQSKEQQTLQDITNFVKNQINNLRNNLAELIENVLKNQTDIQTNKINTYQDIQKLITNIKNDCNTIITDNEQFWNKLIKDQKNSQKNDQIKILQFQLTKQTQKHNQQIEQLKFYIKNYQNQNKTLILGFQQLKNLYQQKQINHKQQVKHLKKNIEELIQRSTKRDKQFDQQIKTMTNQIQNITARYYQNIESPNRKMTQKIITEIQQISQEINKIHTNPILKNSIENLTKILSSSIKQNNQNYIKQTKLQQNITNISKNIQKLTNYIKQLQQNKPAYQKQLISQKILRKQLEKQYQQKQLDLKQKINKNNYQIIITKKHLNKLKQYCNNLQNKFNSKNHKKQNLNLKQSHQNKIIIQLQSQNITLKQTLLQQKTKHTEEIEKLKKYIEISSQIQSQKTPFDYIQSIITQLNHNNQKINQYLQTQQDTQNQLKSQLKNINKFLIKPIQEFHHFQQELNTTSALHFNNNNNIHNNLHNNVHNNIHNNSKSQKWANQSKLYKQILSKKSQTNTQTTKLLSQLIKTIKQHSKQNKQNKQTKQKVTSKKQQQYNNFISSINKKYQSKFKGIQKKIKQIQNQKIKQKFQFIQNLQNIEKQIQKINQKIIKNTNLKNTLNKFEISLQAKIDQIVNKTQIKLDKAQIFGLKDQVIADLRSKLNQANNQSQGLRKQMSILITQKK